MTATFSPDRTYRYDLHRSVAPLDGRGTALWIMLNPSTADETRDDPTIRRVLDFSRRWARVSDVTVCNLFALRATNPGRLVEAHETGVDVIGPENEQTIERHLRSAFIVVAAWGSWWETVGRRRGLPRIDVEALAAAAGRRLYCVGMTDAGTPRHPLYVPKRQPFVPFG